VRTAALLADLLEGLGLARIKIIRCLLRRICQETDGVETHDEFLSRVTGAAACLAVKLIKRTESFGLAADDRDHQGKPE
jgi:hypothetical protein